MRLINEELATFENLPKIIGLYFESIPADALDRRRGADVWTIREHLYHIVDVQLMLLGRMRRIRELDNAVIEPFFPQNELSLAEKYASVSDALAAYAELRAEQMTLLKQCTDADFAKSAVHKEYSRYSIPIIVKHMIFHEYWHMYRIEELWLTNDEYFK